MEMFLHLHRRLLVCLALFGAVLFGAHNIIAAAGDLYVGGLNDHKIYRFDTSANRTTFVTLSNAESPDYLAFDAKGNLFAASNTSILKISPAGSVSTFATGVIPGGLAFDSNGILYAIDTGTGNIYKYTPTGTRTTFATGLSGPTSLAFDRTGNLFVTVAGNGQPGGGQILKFTPPSGTPTVFKSGLSLPQGLAFDGFGFLYEADLGTGSIQKFDTSGNQSTFNATVLNGPRSIAFDRNGSLFVSEFSTDDIVKLNTSGVVSPFTTTTQRVGGIAFEPPTAMLGNISTRAFVGTGDAVTICGFVIAGTDNKQVLVRGIGPDLAGPPFNVPNTLQDPFLNMVNVTTNNDWQQAGNANQIPANFQPGFASDAAILTTLAPGPYTTIMSGNNNTTGNALVDAYDFNTSAFSEFINISTRGFVGANDSVMIGGFINSGGNGVIEVVIRALGPTLSQPPFSVAGTLADPMLDLRDANGNPIMSNDNWQSTQANAIQRTGLAPPNSLESAIRILLQNGNYTAIMSGQGGGTGIGLVEVYKLRDTQLR